jgi:hypothetical protein
MARYTLGRQLCLAARTASRNIIPHTRTGGENFRQSSVLVLSIIRRGIESGHEECLPDGSGARFLCAGVGWAGNRYGGLVDAAVIDYSDPDALKKAILHYEILGKPLALRDESAQGSAF